MARLTRTMGICAVVAMVGLVGACGDDDDGGGTPDASTGSNVDARPGGTPDAMQTGAVTIPVTLSPGVEVPLCTAGNAGAGGQGMVVVNAANTQITVSLTFQMLSGAPTMGHIHFGNAGAMGPVVIPFPTPINTPFTATFTSANYTQAGTSPATFADFITAMKAGGAYINLHTTACGGGEIRGQIMAP